jgi:hypothetical protein
VISVNQQGSECESNKTEGRKRPAMSLIHLSFLLRRPF